MNPNPENHEWRKALFAVNLEPAKPLNFGRPPISKREQTLRVYEAAHKIWMDTPVDTPEGRAAKIAKEHARIEYENTLDAPTEPSHPDCPIDPPKAFCSECYGEHEPSGTRFDCILYWKSTALKNRELVEWAVTLLCSATPNSKFQNETQQRLWAKAFGKFFAEACEKQPKLNDWGVAHGICQWLMESKYRSIQHRHDGSCRAIDESKSTEANAETLPLLHDLLLNLPKTPCLTTPAK